MSKNQQHDCVKRRGVGWGGGGGGRAVYTMCKKTSDLVEDGFPLSNTDNLNMTRSTLFILPHNLEALQMRLLLFGGRSKDQF